VLKDVPPTTAAIAWLVDPARMARDSQLV